MWIFHAAYFKYTDFSVEYNIAEKPLTYFSSYVFFVCQPYQLPTVTKCCLFIHISKTFKTFLFEIEKKKTI